ncbi:hypothetical protein [Variovorax sp. J22R115]|uniref:hypothetical protein n=1 Tax=Variovorax sp. J22R115 TaxID=3053509 RepID=UPI00257569C4|nr:hypothetical protein [Variovorax sp. J22R115]MDM0052971.1 hypothetical protein [Variovorax sp. J22R115]
MLTTDQKEAILRRAGVAVPDFPSGPPRSKAQEPDARGNAAWSGKRSVSGSRRAAIGQWAATIDALYVEYVARRAAKSLRDAEEARQLSLLRLAGQRSGT